MTSAAARAALARGDMAALRRHAETLLAEQPQDAEGPFLLALAEAQTGRIGAAIGHIEAAVAITPRAEYRAQLARLLVTARRDAQAAEVLAALEADPPDDPLSHDTIGCVQARLGDHEAALPHFDIAVRLDPRRPDFRYNRAATLGFLGRTDDAEAELEALLALQPDNARAHHLLSSLRRQSATHNHVARLRQRLGDAGPGPDRLLLGYALAKELEDLGQAQDSFAQLASANAEHRRSLPYAFASDAAIFDAIERHWMHSAVSTAAPHGSGAPIFIVGMPRTGTTLVDRILSSHPDVESAGELQAMPLAVKAASGTRTRTVLDPETVVAAARVDSAQLGRDYLQRAQSHRRRQTPRFIDKFPGNFQYLGPIARALPDAAIICLRRHPLDTVLANFRNLFAISSRYYDYSYDLRDIAAYYARFDQLMAQWKRAFPGRVLELSYEALVSDQEAQTRRLLAHCGLGWDPRCLDFHTNAAPVSTPSAAQVRRPLYSESIGRWRHHAQSLESARHLLEAAGIAVD